MARDRMASDRSAKAKTTRDRITKDKIQNLDFIGIELIIHSIKSQTLRKYKKIFI
jgi:hypothetical protein